MRMRTLLILATAFTMLYTSGCSRNMVGGAAIGAGAAGAAYEYQNKKAIEQLEDDLEAGRISKEEYFRRKEEIKSKSIVY